MVKNTKLFCVLPEIYNRAKNSFGSSVVHNLTEQMKQLTAVSDNNQYCH
jgi:hypothetical protein